MDRDLFYKWADLRYSVPKRISRFLDYPAQKAKSHAINGLITYLQKSPRLIEAKGEVDSANKKIDELVDRLRMRHARLKSHCECVSCDSKRVLHQLWEEAVNHGVRCPQDCKCRINEKYIDINK